MSAEKLIANSLEVLIAVAGIAASAQLSISLPETISVAPITGQSLVVLLVAHLQKWKLGSISIFLYLTLGILGLPIFSNFSGGMEVFTGNSMGYLIGFLIATFVIGYLAEKQEERFGFYFLQMFIGTLIILLCGFLGLLRFLDVTDALQYGIKPFLPGAFVKILVGSILLSVYRRFRFLMNFDKPQTP